MVITSSLSQPSALIPMELAPSAQDNVNIKLLQDGYEKLTKSEERGISMNDLLTLLAEIFQSSYALHAEIAQARIQEAKVTTDIARMLAADKCHDSQVKFAIQVVSGAFNIAINTFSAAKTASGKPLRDDHLAKGGKVDKLTSEQIDRHTAHLQQMRNAKFGAVSQAANMANSVSRDATEIYHANEVQTQEEAQATLKLKEKLDALKDLVFQHFATLLTKLNELLNDLEKARLATNR
ncbi:type III secretion system protein [Vibrio aestuarianus]|uniref:Type III secretion system protein n=1 Tax=Vibrio aestuarianus TaxID=28171 RepID=A0A9X4EYH0_9VIBR|nr:type III secretion system protein [Vibrio aestuarianus]MDE1241090.1 type III secretion system protein [Vibrio aestuarianus]MDE1265075.1 type III secretion system protein [Vibrio aestuarianus]MDE1297003.1 type III secretion system protein [Vibrio aestuarianus]MDE1336226.1 type III secretion system protein [Vibrio aestuarianus]